VSFSVQVHNAGQFSVQDQRACARAGDVGLYEFEMSETTTNHEKALSCDTQGNQDKCDKLGLCSASTAVCIHHISQSVRLALSLKTYSDRSQLAYVKVVVTG